MKPTHSMEFLRAEPLRVVPPGDRRGRRTLTTLDALNRRDALLIEAADRFCINMSARETARRLHSALLRYRAGAWRRTRADLVCRHPAERLDAALWELLHARDYVPSERLIRAVLSRTAGVP
jgi:hypothetical protein